MKYIDGFRNPRAARALRERLQHAGREAVKAHGPVRIMEVCGSHTMSVARYGIRDILPEDVHLISGPGCPVCVTAPGYIDAAMLLATGGKTVVTFGDMLPVPGSEQSLSDCRAAGGRVEICYSPTAAVELARHEPSTEVVFLAIGFETTIAPVVSLVDSCARARVENLSLLTAFKLVPPALRALIDDPEIRVDGFLCPAHVSAIIGPEAYRPFAEEDGLPCVIAGFEPLDILLGLEGILLQIAEGRASVENQYARVVKPGGNAKAQALMARTLEPVDSVWRGIGMLPASALGLRDEWSSFDASVRHDTPVEAGREHPRCRCGDVIKGKIPPPECPMFGKACRPDHPIGPCMVSTEGSCSAYYKYERT